MSKLTQPNRIDYTSLPDEIRLSRKTADHRGTSRLNVSPRDALFLIRGESNPTLWLIAGRYAHAV